MEVTSAPFQPSHWMNLGYDGPHAIAMSFLHRVLLDATNNIRQLAAESATGPEIVVGITDSRIVAMMQYTAEMNDMPLLPDTSLLPVWRDFAEALCSLQGIKLDLSFHSVQLPEEVLVILEPALKTAPIGSLELFDNGLGSNGIKFLVRVIGANTSLSTFYLDKNGIEDGNELLHLVKAVADHPRLEVFGLRKCVGINRVLQANPETVPILMNVQIVSVSFNQLGSHAALLISNCLASNPNVKILHLNGNSFNDSDAGLFANALGNNTNLVNLDLHGNNFTDAGVKTLYRSVYDDTSLNAICDSNHTCRLELFAESDSIPSGINEAVLNINGRKFGGNAFPLPALLRCHKAADGDSDAFAKMLNEEGRKKIKMLHAIQGGIPGQYNMKYLNMLPLELMPELLAFLQDAGKLSGTKENNLERISQVVREKREVTSCNKNVQGWTSGVATFMATAMKIIYWCTWICVGVSVFKEISSNVLK